jgi:hypothetical protein
MMTEGPWTPPAGGSAPPSEQMPPGGWWQDGSWGPSPTGWQPTWQEAGAPTALAPPRHLSGADAAPRGWYPDPLRIAAARLWTGRHWTCWIAAGDLRSSWDAATAVELLRDPAAAEAHARLESVRTFIAGEAGAARLSRSAADETLFLVAQRMDDVLAPRLPPPLLRPAAPWSQDAAHPAPPVVPTLARPRPQGVPLPAPALRGPAPTSARVLTALRGRFVADVGVHWLTYVGILLLFAGVFGLVVFSFSDVRRPLRPLAELAVPVLTFGGAWFVTRQGSPHVGKALQVLGAALVPIAVLAAFVDGAPWPPDPSGAARPATLAASLVVVCLVYAAVTYRRPATPLRYFVGPTLWLAAAMAALALRAPVPAGRDIATVEAGQVAVVAGTLAATALVVRLRLLAFLRDGVDRAAVAAGPVVVLLAAAAAPEHGWPSWPLAASAVALAVLVQTVGRRLPVAAISAVQWALLTLALAAAPGGVSAPARAAAGGLLALALAEWHGARRPSPVTSYLMLPAAFFSLCVAAGFAAPRMESPALAVGVGVAAAWCVVRHLLRPPWLSGVMTSIGTAVLAPLAVAAWAPVIGTAPALLSGAGVSLALAAGIRLGSAGPDPLWRWWLPAAAAAAAVATAGEAGDPTATTVATVVVAGVAVAVSSALPALRAWVVVALGGYAVALGATAAGASRPVAACVVAVATTAVVAAATFLRAPWAGHVVLSAHAVGVVSVAVSGVVGGWATGALAAVVVALVVTATAIEVDRSPVRAVTAGLGVAPVVTRAVSSTTAVIAVPLLAADVADAVGADLSSPWRFALASAPAVACAVLARRWLRRRPLSSVLSQAAFWLAASGVALTRGATEAMLVALVAGVLSTALLGPLALRPMRFAARAAVLPASVYAALTAGLPREHWPWVLLLVSVAAIGAAVADDLVRSSGRPPLLTVRGARVVDQLAIGCAGAVIGWVGTLAVADRAGVAISLLVVAATVAVVAWWLRATALSGVTELLALVAVGLLLPPSVAARALTFVAGVVVLLLVAALWTRGAAPRPVTVDALWSRGDLPAFALAHALAVVAVLLALDEGTTLETWLPLAALSMAVAWRIHRAEWWIGGVTLALAALAAEGSPWRAGALALAAAITTAAASRVSGQTRTAAQWTAVGFGVAAYADLLLWATGDDAVRIGVTAVLAGATIAVTGAGARDPRLRQWVLPWAVAAGLFLGVSAAAAPPLTDRPVAWSLCGGFALAALGPAVSASRLAAGSALRVATALLLLAGAAHAWYAADASADVVAGTAAVVGLAAAVACIAVRYSPRTFPWRGAAAVFSAATAATSVVAGAFAGGWWLSLPLLFAATDAALVGLALRAWWALALAPVLAYAGWAAHVPTALGGDANWYTVPAGMLLAGSVDVVRHERPDQRRRTYLVALDLAAVLAMIGVGLVQTMVTSTAYGLLVIATALVVGAWAIATRVRRRLLAAAGCVALALLAMVVLPLVGLLGEIRGAGLWIAVAAVGVVAIAVATYLERGLTVTRERIARLRASTADWE